MDSNETVITAAGPEDLIATVWFSLGYKPRNSLVLLGLEGPRRRVGVCLRSDLPRTGPGERPGEVLRPVDRLPAGLLEVMLPCMVRDLLGTVAASGARGVLAMVADEQALDQRPPPVLRLLMDGVRDTGLQLVDVLAVTSSAFASLMCGDPRCCPPGGRPIGQVLSSRSAALHVVNGDTVVETEADLLLDVTPAASGRSGGLPAAPACQAPAGLAGHPHTPARLSPEWRWRWWRSWVRACADAATVPARGRPPAGLGPALHDAYFRDAVLMDLLGASEQEVAAMLDGTYGWRSEHLVHPRGPGSDLGRLLLRRPDEHRLNAGRAVLAGAARMAGAGDRGPGLAVLAMLAWFEGRGGRARLLVERARADLPTVSLTDLVEDLLVRRIAPPWLRNGSEGPRS